MTEILPRDQLWGRAFELASFWDSLDRPYRAALEQGLIYARLGNPIGKAQVGERAPRVENPRIR